MKIGVLLGGESAERDISIASGTAIAEALLAKGYDVIKIDGTMDNVKKIKKGDFDLIFIALHGGYGEGGDIQEILEKKEILYTGSSPKASRIGLDKAASKDLFLKNNIPTASYKIFFKNKTYDKKFLKQDLPFIVKPRFQGSSIGLSLVSQEDQIKQAFDHAFKYDDDLIIESYIKGRELTVGILNHQALPVIEVVPSHDVFDFFCKYNKGQTNYIVPADIEKDIALQVQKIALKVFEVIGCREYARVDVMLDKKNNPYVLEINTIPGFTQTSLLPKAAKCIGIGFEDLCDQIVKAAFLRGNACDKKKKVIL